ncbi:hypothetical protein GCM10020220_018370 [Nonomuraea rubra]|uniref:hypothetical protein n=1 Tax=Nonomuraea rubra TaxID=46180 RepID=UPI0031F1846F
MIRISATVPVRALPRWALLERELLARLDRAWRTFESRFCEPDGRLRYRGRMYGRDGVDDFYEPFFNWPVLYRLGGAGDLLDAAKHHWEGVTRQLAGFGFVREEYEVGYDWFHQGESLPFFLAICAADPADAAFRARARRFAELYLPGAGNYDPATRTIVAPHTGSGGPRWGVGEDWEEYRADQPGMEIYGLPLLDVPGVRTWDDLRDPAAARAMGRAMQERMGRGDTAVNLAATTLATNAWLYDHDPRLSDWVIEYVDAWRERAAANGGVLPDNVGPGGTVGELHGGAWYGGHYGWTWPHGLHSIAPRRHGRRAQLRRAHRHARPARPRRRHPRRRDGAGRGRRPHRHPRQPRPRLGRTARRRRQHPRAARALPARPAGLVRPAPGAARARAVAGVGARRRRARPPPGAAARRLRLRLGGGALVP